jgi:hypothetical protein
MMQAVASGPGPSSAARARTYVGGAVACAYSRALGACIKVPLNNATATRQCCKIVLIAAIDGDQTCLVISNVRNSMVPPHFLGPLHHWPSGCPLKLIPCTCFTLVTGLVFDRMPAINNLPVAFWSILRKGTVMRSSDFCSLIAFSIVEARAATHGPEQQPIPPVQGLTGLTALPIRHG